MWKIKINLFRKHFIVGLENEEEFNGRSTNGNRNGFDAIILHAGNAKVIHTKRCRQLNKEIFRPLKKNINQQKLKLEWHIRRMEMLVGFLPKSGWMRLIAGTRRRAFNINGYRSGHDW